jgi:hypothetical protein
VTQYRGTVAVVRTEEEQQYVLEKKQKYVLKKKQ